MNFYTVDKSPRRALVMLERTLSHTSGHNMQSLEVLCETDSPQVIVWALGGLDGIRGAFFARQLLDAAAMADPGAVILAKDIPPALYISNNESRLRRLWDGLKTAIAHFSLRPSWEWTDSDKQNARDLEAAFAAFIAERGAGR